MNKRIIVALAAILTACGSFGQEYAKKIHYADIELRAWTAVSNLTATLNTNGAMTGARYYRVSATNLAGRIPATAMTNLTCATNGVTLQWKRRDGLMSYVVERSFDNTTWTNWATVAMGTTNFTDYGTNTWNATAFTGVVSSIAAPTAIGFPFLPTNAVDGITITYTGGVLSAVIPSGSNYDAAAAAAALSNALGSAAFTEATAYDAAGTAAAVSNAAWATFVELGAFDSLSNTVAYFSQFQDYTNWVNAQGWVTASVTDTVNTVLGARITGVETGKVDKTATNDWTVSSHDGLAPYTNATGNLYLGAHTLFANRLSTAGGYIDFAAGQYIQYDPFGGYFYFTSPLYGDGSQLSGVVPTNSGDYQNLLTNTASLVDFLAHTNNGVIHIAGDERALWDSAFTTASNAAADIVLIKLWPTNEWALYGVTNLVPTNAPVAESYIDGHTFVLGTNAGTASTSTVSVAASETFPAFRIDVGLVDGNWTDFEIKATTNNFTNLVYYYKSWTPTQDEDFGDTNAWAYYTDDYTEDVRRWHRKPLTNSISSQLLNTNSVVQWVYFFPSHECEYPWTNWMYKTNVHLIWSYVRVDDVGLEENFDGSKQRWNPIRPDSWEAERTTP